MLGKIQSLIFYRPRDAQGVDCEVCGNSQVSNFTNFSDVNLGAYYTGKRRSYSILFSIHFSLIFPTHFLVVVTLLSPFSQISR